MTLTRNEVFDRLREREPTFDKARAEKAIFSQGHREIFIMAKTSVQERST
jgi:hypothetical protein